jgi:penicillin-binding protein 2A
VLSVVPTREHGRFMKALRWILFSLLAFGIGAGAAFAFHPPTIGIPTATASKLSDDLTAIRSAATDGQCDDVRSRLLRAQSRINHLPESTATSTVTTLQSSLEKVRSAALETCSAVANAAAQEATPTTPDDTVDTTPATTPPDTEATTPAITTPDDTGGDDGGGADPGTGEGTGGTTTTPDSSGDGTGNNGNGQGNGNGNGQGNGGTALPGGISVPSPGAVRQKIEEAQRRFREAWGN